MGTIFGQMTPGCIKWLTSVAVFLYYRYTSELIGISPGGGLIILIKDFFRIYNTQYSGSITRFKEHMKNDDNQRTLIPRKPKDIK
jgi:hypothetical protein